MFSVIKIQELCKVVDVFCASLTRIDERNHRLLRYTTSIPRYTSHIRKTRVDSCGVGLQYEVFCELPRFNCMGLRRVGCCDVLGGGCHGDMGLLCGVIAREAGRPNRNGGCRTGIVVAGPEWWLQERDGG